MKRQSKKKMEALMEQYPAVSKLYRYAVHGGDQPSYVEIKVQRADPSFMYKQPDNIEISGNSYIHRTDGLKGARCEYACSVSAPDQVIVERTTWGPSSGRYVRDVFREQFRLDQVVYIIWVTELNWHQKPSEEDRLRGINWGAHCERELYYTIYLPPKEGFEELYKRADVTKNIELTDTMLTQGYLNKEKPFELICQRFGDLARRFEERVFHHDLGKIIYQSRFRGMSGVFDGVTLMSYVMAGRLMITFQAPNLDDPNLKDSFTLLGLELKDQPQLSYRSVFATADRAEELVNRVIRAWEKLSAEKRREMYQDSSEVGLG